MHVVLISRLVVVTFVKICKDIGAATIRRDSINFVDFFKDLCILGLLIEEILILNYKRFFP